MSTPNKKIYSEVCKCLLGNSVIVIHDCSCTTFVDRLGYNCIHALERGGVLTIHVLERGGALTIFMHYYWME